MIARVVKDQDVLARLHVAPDDVPGGTDQIVALRQHLGMGKAARGDDDIVGIGRQHVAGLGQGIEAKAHAALFAHRHPP